MRITKLTLCLALFCVMLTTACSNTKPTKDMGELNFKDLDDTDKEQFL